MENHRKKNNCLQPMTDRFNSRINPTTNLQPYRTYVCTRLCKKYERVARGRVQKKPCLTAIRIQTKMEVELSLWLTFARFVKERRLLRLGGAAGGGRGGAPGSALLSPARAARDAALR